MQGFFSTDRLCERFFHAHILLVDESGMQHPPHTHTHTHTLVLPLQQLPHHVIDGKGLFTAERSWLNFLWRPLHPLSTCCNLPAHLRFFKEKWGKKHALPNKTAVWRGRIHMLNVTYIWYSSIASTNCPQESKSVPFLKLACHFWIVLLTSDMLAGRILAALSGQHSRGGGSSTGLQRRWQRRLQAGSLLLRSRTDTPVTTRPSPFCLQYRIRSRKEVPPGEEGCARYGRQGTPSGRQRDVCRVGCKKQGLSI